MGLLGHRAKNRRIGGFTLVELLVVIAIIAILSILFVGAIRKGIQSAQRARAASYIRQIIIAYTNYTTGWGSDLGNITVPEGGTAHDWIKVLAERDYFNDPRLVMFDFDALVRQYTSAGFIPCWLHFFGVMPRQIWNPSQKQFDENFYPNPLSISCISGLKVLDCTEPLIMSRGLGDDGYWHPVSGTTGDGSDSGVWGSEGGLVGFVNGQVKWFPRFLWRRYYAPDEETHNIRETVNDGTVIVTWQDGSSAGDTPPSPPPTPPEPEEPGENENSEEEPVEPDEGGDTTPDESEEPTEPDLEPEPEPEPEKPGGPVTVEDMMDFFKDGDGVWGTAQSDILYAMDGQAGSTNIPGAIYRLFDAYYSQTSITPQTCAQLVSNSFNPAYANIYGKLGDLAHGNSGDINAALAHGGYSGLIDVEAAKSLATAYKATVDQSIAPYLKDATYNTYLELLTTELVNPKEGHDYYKDERIVRMDYSDPKVTLAFAHVAIDMINYMLAEL
jgi:prepilin-type N-terminal cleavage/methylation domain-containing protein